MSESFARLGWASYYIDDGCTCSFNLETFVFILSPIVSWLLFVLLFPLGRMGACVFCSTQELVVVVL